MLRLNRTTEYGIFALRHLDQKGLGESASAREIADQFGLPFDITAKTLQRLKDAGLIASAQGSRGGYKLQRSLDEVNLAEFLDMMEEKCHLRFQRPRRAGPRYAPEIL